MGIDWNEGPYSAAIFFEVKAWRSAEDGRWKVRAGATTTADPQDFETKEAALARAAELFRLEAMAALGRHGATRITWDDDKAWNRCPKCDVCWSVRHVKDNRTTVVYCPECGMIREAVKWERGT